MKKEIEILYYDIDKNQIREKLVELNAEKVYDEFLQKRVVYDFGEAEGFFSWMRLRKEKDKVVLSYKKTKVGEFAFEKELTVSDFDEARDILKLIGMHESSYQENYREKYNLGDVEIVTDTWPFLNSNIEIEADEEEKVKKVAELLGLDEIKSFKGSINNVYKIKYGKTIEEVANGKPITLSFDVENIFL